jgi:hypothetical protein
MKRKFIIFIILLFILASCSNTKNAEIKDNVLKNYISVCLNIKDVEQKVNFLSIKNIDILNEYQSVIKNNGFKDIKNFYNVHTNILTNYLIVKGLDGTSKIEGTINQKTEEIQKKLENPIIKTITENELNQSIEDTKKIYNESKKMLADISDLFNINNYKKNQELIKNNLSQLDKIYQKNN